MAGPVEAPILWAGGDLSPVTEALVPLWEEVCHDKKLSKLRKAKIDAAVIREIERDFAWPQKSKTMLSQTSASLGAKWLNRAGLSAAYKDEVNFGVALLVIMRCEASVNRRLDKLIAAAEAAEKAREQAAKAAASAATVTPQGEKTVNLTDALKIPAALAPEKK